MNFNAVKVMIFVLVSVLAVQISEFEAYAESGSLANELQPVNLQCEYLSNPLGIDTDVPRFSWEFTSDTKFLRGTRQTAYRVLVASNEEMFQEGKADLWDSGKIVSNNTMGIEYSGRKLRSSERCCWKVLVWNQDDKASPWSETAFWTMGLLKASDWQAKWIGVPDSASQKSEFFRDWKRSVAGPSDPVPARGPAG